MRDAIPALGAALLAAALETLGRFTVNGPQLPELMAEAFFALIPVWAFTPLFRAFGYNSKYYAFGGMIAVEIVGLTLLGIAIRKWMRRRNGTGLERTWLAALVAIVLAVVILIGLLPLLGAGMAGQALVGGAPATLATVILVTAAYVTVLSWRVRP